MQILKSRGWLSGPSAEFGDAILSRCEWGRLEAGAPIQFGGEAQGELIGLAHGIIELRTVLGRADTPLMHLAHPVFWFGFAPIVYGRPRPLAASAKSTVWLARIAQPALTALLAERPEWWRQFVQLALLYGDTAVAIAADLLIRDSERRCGAALLRLAGCRFAGPDDTKPVQVSVTQDSLAGAANLSRNSVGTLLRRLTGRGLVAPGVRTIAIRARGALRAFVDEE
jgi:CRP-like cAMP-binding protein